MTWRMLLLAGVCAALGGCAQVGQPRVVKLFNGRDLTGWRVPREEFYSAAGKVYAAGGAMHLEAGHDMTGAAWTGAPPTDEYEIELEAMRVAGEDFFCGLTFPVGRQFATLIVGGWGGQVVGISNIDGQAANENETTQGIEFAKGRWYPIRLRVAEGYVEVWIDGKQVIELERGTKQFGIWAQQEDVRPLGLNTWCTHGAMRNIILRRLRAD